MGPIALFDKSFIQSLSVDESVWFDHYFLSVVAPYFYIETLADLSKSGGARTPDAEVRVIAEKFPDMHGRPCVHHVDAAIGNLLGVPVPMDGRIPLPGGFAFVHEGREAVAWDESPEALAFSRWQSEDFHSVERDFAHKWRATLTILPLDAIWSSMQAIGIGGMSSKSLADAYETAVDAVGDASKAGELIDLAVLFLGGTPQQSSVARERWEVAGRPPLRTLAPYTAYVLSVEIFFQAAMSAGLIARERPFNRIDIAYLYYLPFCMVFASSDKLHRRCASLFLRPDQDFVWGPDLKLDLAALNHHFVGLPQSERSRGVITIDDEPPAGVADLVERLFARHMGNAAPWAKDLTATSSSEHANVRATLPSDAHGGLGHSVPYSSEPDALMFKRSVRRRRGSWLQIPDTAK